MAGTVRPLLSYNNMHSVIYSFPVAAINIDMLIGIFVLLSIIGRMMKARKPEEEQQSTPQPNASRRPASDPQAELEEFLKSLVGAPNLTGSQPVKTPPAPPSPVKRPPPPPSNALNYAKRKSPPHNPRKQTSPAPERKALPIQPARNRPAMKQVELHNNRIIVAPKAAGGVRKQHYLFKELSCRKNIRKAVVLREILGPPLALRKTGTS